MIRSVLTSKWFYGALAGVLVWAGLTLFSVMHWAEAAMLIAIAFVVAFIGTRKTNLHNVSWETPVVRHTRQGARDDIMHLSWLLFGRGREVTFGGMKHVREAVDTVFGSLGIDQHSPSHSVYLRSQLGTKIANAILGDDPELNLTDRELNRLLNFLDALIAQDADSIQAAINTNDHNAMTPTPKTESEVAS